MSTRFSRAGFTLIELLVVISIIGLMASVVLASLQSARKKATTNATVSQVQQYVYALELYRDDHGGYPAIPAPPGFNGSCLGTGYPGGLCGWYSTASAAKENPALVAALSPYISQQSFNFGPVTWEDENGSWEWRGAYYFCVPVNGACADAVLMWRIPSSGVNCFVPGAQYFPGGGSLACQLVLVGNAQPNIVNPQ